MTKIECVQKYFDSWLSQNNASWDILFDDNIYYSEYYGPAYLGLERLKLWFSEWNTFGIVKEWNILSSFEDETHCCVEWFFCVQYLGEEEAFDGVSIFTFTKEGKMVSVKEYQSSLPHVLQDI
ncbi:MAG: nuclear transport factor 2 family protein [Longicatena sp.]